MAGLRHCYDNVGLSCSKPLFSSSRTRTSMNSSESARALTAALTSAWCLTAGPLAASLLPLSGARFDVLAASLTVLALHQHIGLSVMGVRATSSCPSFLWKLGQL